AASGSVVCRNKNGTHAASRPFLIIFVVAFAITQLAQPTRPSGANSVIYALLGEARFGRAGELLLGSLGRTGGRRVLFAFRHKALKCRAGKLLVGSLAFARRVLSEGSRREGREQCCQQNLFHRILLDCVSARIIAPAEHCGAAVIREPARKTSDCSLQSVGGAKGPSALPPGRGGGGGAEPGRGPAGRRGPVGGPSPA